jgi:hypothetical protein
MKTVAQIVARKTEIILLPLLVAVSLTWKRAKREVALEGCQKRANRQKRDRGLQAN